MKTNSLTSLRNKCDALLTPLIQKLYPECLLCGHPTQVAHHHVHKSKSSRLRYEIDNLIPLCHHCHVVLHHNESYWAGKIIEKRGMKWFKKLDKLKNEIVNVDRFFYERHFARLSSLL